MSIKSLFIIETIQLKSSKVLKSWKITTEKFCWYRGLNPGLHLPIMSLKHILLNSIDADMKLEIGSSRGGLRPYPLRFHVEEAGADAKLNQHGPLGVAYHRRHPISTVPVARITAHATVPGQKILCFLTSFIQFFNKIFAVPLLFFRLFNSCKKSSKTWQSKINKNDVRFD